MSKGVISYLKNVRANILYSSAVAANKIREFDESINENLRNVIYAVLPSIIYIKYERPLTPPGNCKERALLLSTAVPNSKVVSGYLRDLGLHYWVEGENTCYDPTSLLEYDKNVFYAINGVKNCQVISKEDLEQMGFIQYCHRRKISDFETDPSYLSDLDAILPYIFKSLKYRLMPEYKKEIDDYLNKLGFYQKRDDKLRQDLFRNL